MLKIGEFSKLSQTPVSTLRYYDEIGLLKPVQVDDFTGYRYYNAEQLPRLNRITALKDVGLRLAEIVQLTADGSSNDHLRDVLERKRGDSVRVVERERGRLTRIESWLENLARGTTMEQYEVTIKKIEPIRAMCLRRVMPSYHSEGELWEELCRYLGTLEDVQYAGPAMNICHDSEYREKDVDIEVAVPVKTAVPNSDDIQMRTLPGCERVVSVLHKGPFDTIINAYQFTLEWIERNGYRMAGPDRVVYHSDPSEVAPEDLLQELQVPIEKK